MLKRQGSNVERELLRKFWEQGWACIRVAGSGSSSFPTPDLIAIKNKNIIAIEVKSTKNNKIYINHIQLEELKLFKDITQIPIYIATKFIGNGWYIFPLENIIKENVISLERAKEEGIEIKEFFKLLNNITNLI